MTGKSELVYQGNRCGFTATGIDTCSEEAVANALMTDVLWSDVANWAGNTLPVEGDDVEILPEWRMTYDITGDSPIFNKITINGELVF